MASRIPDFRQSHSLTVLCHMADYSPSHNAIDQYIVSQLDLYRANPFPASSSSAQASPSPIRRRQRRAYTAAAAPRLHLSKSASKPTSSTPETYK